MKKGQEFKVECHHIMGIDVWDNIISLIQEQLLCDVDELQTLCRDCHDTITTNQ